MSMRFSALSYFAAIVVILTVECVGSFTPNTFVQRRNREKPTAFSVYRWVDERGASSTRLSRLLLRSPTAYFSRIERDRRKHKLSSVLFSLLAVTFAWPGRALAVSSLTSWQSSVASLKSLRRSLVTYRKPILQTALALFFTRVFVRWILCKRRQAKDATSEWGRYAQFPAARGRAVLSLVALQLFPLWLLSRFFFRNRLLNFSGRVFADGLLKLGPLYIKLGQIVSCREKLLPEQWIKAMERLQDQVPAKSGAEALALVDAAWPNGLEDFNRTFSDFDATPLAAASLGQVHKAVLTETGDVVAIKLQRPYLREIYDQDFVFLTKVAALIDRFGGSRGQVGGVSQSWVEIFDDAEEILYREIDYRDEAYNGLRFCHDFGLALGGAANRSTAVSRDGKALPSAAPWLRAPYVYDNLSSEKVLTMEFVPSIKINNEAKLQKANVTMEQREYLADCLARAYLRQFCCNLFFSTDPHPGNLGCEILPDNANGVRLVFYDFGQAANLTDGQADGILEIIEAIVDSDVDQSMEAFEKMGVLKDDADLDKVRAKVADNYKTGKVKANRKRLSKRGYKFKDQVPATVINSTNTNTTSSDDTKDSEVMSFFTLPAEYAFVGRALSQMDGVGKFLDSEFDFISSAAPWIYEIKGAGKYLKEEVIKWMRSVWVKVDKIHPHYVKNITDETVRRKEEHERRSLRRIGKQ